MLNPCLPQVVFRKHANLVDLVDSESRKDLERIFHILQKEEELSDYTHEMENSSRTKTQWMVGYDVHSVAIFWHHLGS